MIEGEDWLRLDALLQAALDRPPEERAQWLEQACGSDRALREKLEELIRLAEDPSEEWRPGAPLAEEPGDGILVPGQNLGRYRVVDLLGAGGMGQVYLAVDPNLGREVAIKALAHAFRGDSGSLKRFEREARVLATLSHPNVAAIYGFERLDGAPYLILERVEGETLAQRLRRGALPLREAAAVALQVAEGLEEAHGKGIIHRDLKPSNVMLEPGGRVKLVDFGLAKTGARRADAASSKESATASSLEPTTASGTILGTAPYMSPEQIHGDEVDTRTDIWAFGCLLYEMLTGQPAFPGRSVPALLAAVLRDDPDWNALPGGLPGNVRRLLGRCLRKDPRARLQHIGDARLELIEVEPEAASAVARPAARSRRALPWIAAAAAIVSLALAGLLLSRWPRRGATLGAARLSLELPAGVTLVSELSPPFAVAPAGSPLVIEGQQEGTERLYVRRLDDVGLRVLAGSEGARQPFFSPDGRTVAFFADRKLKKLPIEGGPVVELADVGRNPRGGAWAADGTIVASLSQTSGLVRIPERGGRPAVLTTLDASRGESSHRWPEALPGGKWVIFTVGLEDAGYDEARLEAVSLQGGERRAVLAGAAFGRYISGSLLFVRSGRLYAIGFDPERLETRGAPEPVLDAVRFDPRNGGCHLAVSASGVLVYATGVPTPTDRYLAWIDREGRLERTVDTPRPFRDPRLSPDGRRVAVVVGTSTESDLWLLDANATLSQITFGLTPHRPAWTPDGKRITVAMQKSGAWQLVSIPAEGGGEPQVLYSGPYRVYPNAWSPDGRRLVFQENRPETGWDLRVVEMDASGSAAGSPQTLAATPFEEAGAAVSPDGKWVAHESDEIDALVQVYVRSFPDGGNKVRASTLGARGPVWGRGGELYFWETIQQQLRVVHPRRGGGGFQTDAVQPVWSGQRPAALARLIVSSGWARFNVDPAGHRFLTLETAAASLEPPLARPVIILGWDGPRPPGSPAP